MLSVKKPYIFTDGKLLFDYTPLYCNTTQALLQSELFAEVLHRFIEKLAAKESPVYEYFNNNIPMSKKHDMVSYIVNFFRLLNSHTSSEILRINEEYKEILIDKEIVLDFIEELYNFWRRFERFMYIVVPKRSRYAKASLHHVQFINMHMEFKNLVLEAYRHIRENLLGQNPRVYRQLPAGSNMGMILEQIEWNCPKMFLSVKDVPFIRITIVEPPLILYPQQNKRKGMFMECSHLTEEMFMVVPDQWFCFPAKVGPLLAFIYFREDYISQGLSLGNLFQIADYEEIEGKLPDIILFFGLTNLPFDNNAMFYEDKDSGLLVGLLKHTEEIDYFGYFKKMTLTLHNIANLKTGKLPVHGAMVNLKVKNAPDVGIVIIGDSGAGKSETLEALRMLADEEIRDMKIIFDDMGSLSITDKGTIVAYGTEIGAFVRLDDLQPGYAYEEIDRSIFMNPNKKNARLIMPVTSYHHIVKGYKVDIVLYANNYEQIADEEPLIEFFNSAEEALTVFKSGARLAKGTTDENGIVHTYFANPFGAPQRKAIHEELSTKYFETMFRCGIKVGQIRTRLGIAGFEQQGPEEASKELLKIIKNL